MFSNLNVAAWTLSIGHCPLDWNSVHLEYEIYWVEVPCHQLLLRRVLLQVVVRWYGCLRLLLGVVVVLLLCLWRLLQPMNSLAQLLSLDRWVW